MLSVLVFPWQLQVLKGHPEVEAVPPSTAKNSSSSKLISTSLPLNTLNSTCVISDVTRMQEKLPWIRKKLLIWHCKPNSTVSTMAMLYIGGIQPRFDILQARHFDSSWNRVRLDALPMYYDMIFSRLTTVDREITARCIALLNRADPDMLQSMQYYHINQCDRSKGETYRLGEEFGQKLIDNTREIIGKLPMYKDGKFSRYLVFRCLSQFFFFKLLSFLRLTQRLQRMVIPNIPKSFAKISVNWRPMSRKWPVGRRSQHPEGSR